MHNGNNALSDYHFKTFPQSSSPFPMSLYQNQMSNSMMSQGMSLPVHIMTSQAPSYMNMGGPQGMSDSARVQELGGNRSSDFAKLTDLSNSNVNKQPNGSGPDNHSNGNSVANHNEETDGNDEGDLAYDSDNDSSSNTSVATNSDGNNFKMAAIKTKRTGSVPLRAKDEGYWEKRRKNNESAKRSRDSRRMKEEQIAMRVVYLEQDNLQLRTEVSLLKSEIEKLRCMLYQP